MFFAHNLLGRLTRLGRLMERMSLPEKDKIMLDYDHDTKHLVNGYRIRWNSYWHMWQVSHPEIGACIAEFKHFEDAREYCLKG